MEINIKTGITATLSRLAAPTDAELCSLAHAIAALAHEGQINKDGTPYICHPLRLAGRWYQDDPTNTDGYILALLHDVLEDTPFTAEILLQLGIPSHIVSGIKKLTRELDPDNCSTADREAAYHAHIEDIAVNASAYVVQTKIYDLEDNMNLTRLDVVGEWELRRTAKYHKAWLRLRREL